MLPKRGQGQSWSLDIILALVIFVLVIGIFYTLLKSNESDQNEHLQLNANTIANNLDSATGLKSTFAIMDRGSIDQQKLAKLYNSTYSSLRNQFGIRGNFCIYIIDQYGNLITVNTTRGELNGFGDGDLSINGLPCGTRVS